MFSNLWFLTFWSLLQLRCVFIDPSLNQIIGLTIERSKICTASEYLCFYASEVFFGSPTKCDSVAIGMRISYTEKTMTGYVWFMIPVVMWSSCMFTVMTADNAEPSQGYVYRLLSIIKKNLSSYFCFFFQTVVLLNRWLIYAVFSDKYRLSFN